MAAPIGDEAIEGLFLLPNEILIYVLSPFSTQLLLPLTTVCRRFHDLILRIVHNRLLHAATLQDRKLILECYHPSSKNTEPYLFCDYLGTPGLSDVTEGEGSAYHAAESITRLSILGGLYSRFRPIRPEVEQRVFRHPAGNTPGYQPRARLVNTGDPTSETQQEELVSHLVNLDSHELFSQLCVVTNLVQLGPRRGVFYSFVNVADGVVRIWRQWLADRAIAESHRSAGISESKEADSMEDDIETEEDLMISPDEEADVRTLWIDNRKDVGIQVRIKERRPRRDVPILQFANEDPAVSYSMEYEELLIRTTHLLFAVEQTLAEQSNASGKAMIFGNFASQGT